MTKALLNRLSLNAPRVWVSNSGRKRRARSNSICLLILQSRLFCDRRPDALDDLVGGVGQGAGEPPIGAEGGGLDDRAHHQRGRQHAVEPSHLAPAHALGEHVVDDVDRVCRSGVAFQPDMLLEQQKAGEVPFPVEKPADEADHRRDLVASRDLARACDAFELFGEPARNSRRRAAPPAPPCWRSSGRASRQRLRRASAIIGIGVASAPRSAKQMQRGGIDAAI